MKYILSIVLCLPALALANFQECTDQGVNVQFPDSGQTGYNSYNWVPNAVTGVCEDAQVTCRAEFADNDKLRGRSWYITDNKDPTGFLYQNNFLQLNNVQCPNGTFLHLYPQYLQTESAGPGQTCPTRDFVRIINPELPGGEDIACGDNTDFQMTSVYNGGFGRVFTNGNAQVEFCTNSNADVGTETGFNPFSESFPERYVGFVVRATCIDPETSFLPGCVDYNFVREWDGDWLALQDEPYEKPERNQIPHKRSIKERARRLAAKHKRAARLFKRGIVSAQRIEFESGQTVEYTGGRFTINFNNGTADLVPAGLWFCVFTESDFIGPRQYFNNAPFIFTGPGTLDLDPKQNLARLRYSVNVTDPIALQSLLLPGVEEMQRVNAIYDYIFCWVSSYPIVDYVGAVGQPYPLARAETVDIAIERQRLMLAEVTGGEIERFGQLKASRNLGFLQEGFWPIQDVSFDDSCYRGTLLDIAPSIRARVPERLFQFCQLFSRSCSPIMRIACEELLRLDPVGARN